ncbi:uncharacterized protein LOC128484207 [Spea bombifrons]|uniref:uncharacterized protein LOC128484207 n=1 Tax=Spea bombifrons TaxID=233779 RepID=UPI00234943B3|nr:uncharacterized protein LOC128484207 [Spea bombifrons]
MEHQRIAEEHSTMDNKNTLKKTKFDLRIIHSYLARVCEERELLKIPVEELDDHLANFICTHRKQDGSEYEPGTLRGILGSLDRHFERSGYPYAIYRFKETMFQKTVKAMKEKQSYLKTIGKGNHPNQAEPLTEREIELLYSTGTIGLHNPSALLHMLFFNIGLHFSLRTMEQHNLKWGDITLKADSRGRKYLEHIKKLAPGRSSGKLHPNQTMRMQIYESPEQPERDVVKAYEKYSVERPVKMKCKDAPFYLTPQPDCRPGYACWFKNLPMGECRIRSIMKNLKAAAGLSPEKKITNHSPMKTSNVMGNVLSLRSKTRRDRRSMNNGSNGHASVNEAGPVLSSPPSPGAVLIVPIVLFPIVKLMFMVPAAVCKDVGGTLRADPDSFGLDDVSDADAQYGSRSGASRSRLPRSRLCSSGFSLNKKIKDEWDMEPETPLSPGPDSGEKNLYEGQVSVAFHDVAAYFSAEEWGLLEDWRKELYKNVMKEIHAALRAMGYTIENSDVLLKIKERDPGRKSPSEDKSAPSTGFSPDILLRIKNDDVSDWKDLEVPEKEVEEMDTSSLPVFDPDLSLWVFREEQDLSSSEDAKDQVLPGDPDEGAHALHSIPSPFKEPAPDMSTMYNPIYSEVPRPGKRKRRPPQRRSTEQSRHADDGGLADCQEDAKHRLVCQNPGLLDQSDWMPHEKVYQCDLCDRSFSDRSIQVKAPVPGMALPCPQCGGTLNLHPLFNRSACTEIEANFAQTFRFTDGPGDSGYPHPMQGPVG